MRLIFLPPLSRDTGWCDVLSGARLRCTRSMSEHQCDAFQYTHTFVPIHKGLSIKNNLPQYRREIGRMTANSSRVPIIAGCQGLR